MTPRRLRICFVTNEYPPRPIWGAGVCAKQLTQGLAGLGHTVYVVTWGPRSKIKTDNLSEYRIKTFDVQRLSEVSFVAKLPKVLIKTFDVQRLSEVSFVAKLPKVLIKLHSLVGGFDILHVNSQFYTALMSLLSSKLSRELRDTPKLVTVHHLLYDVVGLTKPTFLARLSRFFNEGGLIPQLIEPVVLKRFDGIIAVSHYTKDALHTAYGISSEKVHVVHNGVSQLSEHSRQMGKQPNLSNTVVLLSIGRMEAKKGIPVLLKAFDFLSSKYKNLKLILVGGGTNSVYNSHQLSAYAKGKIEAYEWVDDEQLQALYEASDIYASASLLEGFGLTILEAMAAGKPVVATRVGAIPEIVQERVNGLLVEPNNWRDLSQSLEYLIENRDLMQKIGQYNKEYVKLHFNWEKTAQKTEEVYRKTIERLR